MPDLADIAKKLYQMGEDLHEGLADGVQKTATRIMNNSKKRLGHYQEGWDTLKDRTVRKKIMKSKTAVVRRLKGQTFAGQKLTIKRVREMYEDDHDSLAKMIHASGTDTDAPLVDDGLLRAGITINMDRVRIAAQVGSPQIYAASQEFGNEDRNIPARPYLRPAFREEIDHLKDDLKDGVAGRMRG